jgi:predicted Zn-dependent peptidase
VLDTILGNAPSSRLFLEVRERRGLAYSVYSWASQHADAGEVGLYVGVRPDRVAQTAAVLRAELDRLIAEPPSHDEVELARGHIEGRILLAAESSVVRGNRLGSALVTGTPLESLADAVSRVQSVTAAQVHELAAELFAPDRLSLALVAEDVEAAIADVAASGLAPQPRSERMSA